MTKWMKRSAAGVLAAALVCGSTPASVLLGSGLTAFAAEDPGVPISDISIIDSDYSPQTLVRGIQNTMTVNLRTYDKMANYINAKIDISPYYAGSEYDLSPYLTAKAQKPTESYSEEYEIYTYTFTLTFDLTNADALENTSFDTLFYLCDITNPDVHRKFANWYPQVAKGTQYEVTDDGSALTYAEFPFGESGTARQISISRDNYEWEDADSFDYRRDSHYYFKCDEADGTDTQTRIDNSDVHLYSLSESGEKTEISDFPGTYFYDNNGRYYEAHYVDNLEAGTYEVDYPVYADDAYDAETQTIGSQTFTLSKTFTVENTELDTDELHYEFGFSNENGERYQLDPEDVTEVPYSGDAYSLGYYNGDYWNWRDDLDGAVYDPQTDTYFEEGTDYIVSGDRGAIGVGAYSFTIEFINGYSGSKTFNWEIVDYDDDDAAPYIQMTDYPYTENNMPVYYYGTEIKPVVYNNKQDGDVTFFYAANKNSGVFSEEVPTEPGRYMVYANISANNGHEEYKTYTATFQIVKTSLTVQPDDLTVTYGDALPELTYSFRTSMQFGYPTEDYEIGVYDENGEEVTGKLNVGTYSLRVKNAPYSSSDKKHYDKSDNYGTLTVLPKRASNILVQALPNIYTGSYQRPEFRVFADGEALVNTDSLTQYKLFGTTVAKNTGVYNAQIQLCGNYKGFNATQWEISDSELDITLGLDIVDVNMAEKKVQFALARVVKNLEVISAGLIYTKTGADIADLTAEDFAASASVLVNGSEAKCASLSTATNTGVTKMRITDSGSGISIKGFIQYHCASGTFYAYTDVLTTDFESAVDQIAATTFNIKISDVDPDSQKVQFALTRSSQNVTPVECGFIYSKTGIKVDDIELGDPRIDGENVKVSMSTNDAANLNLKQRITDAGSGISIRGYVKYLTSDGSERIAYTEETLNTTYEDAYAAFMQS